MTERPIFKGIPGGKAPAQPPSLDVVRDLEDSLLGKVLIDPSAIPTVLDFLEPSDLSPPRRAVFEVLLEQRESGLPVSLPALVDDLDRAGTLKLAGGVAAVAELADREASSVGVDDIARRIRRLAIEQRARLLAGQIAAGDRDDSTRAALRDLEEQLEAVNVGALDLAAAGFSGERTEALRERPRRVSPFPRLLPPEPALGVLNGRAKTGKSRLALYLAQAWACGVSPWEGAPALPGSRALVLSAEQPAEVVETTLRQLDVMSAEVTRETWTERLTLIARDPELPRSAARMLTLDATGRTLLRQGLLRARREGDPYGLAVLDSLSRLVPEGFDENDNTAMTAWLAPLQELAEELGVYVLAIHHVGHGEGRVEARTAGRGASALSAVAQVVWLLENHADDPRQRRLHVQGNAVSESRLTFAVAGESSEPGLIHYWHPSNPLDHYSLEELVAEGEEISTSELALRLDPNPREGQRPGRTVQRLAAQLREEWHRRGLIEVREGARRSKLLRRKHPDDGGETE